MATRRIALASALLLLATATAAAQTAAVDAALAEVRAYREAHATEIVEELVEWLSLPNDAQFPEDIQRNAEGLKAMMERRGIRTEIIPLPGGRPLLYGELPAPGATTTLLFYCHYDGQAVDRSKWHSDPYRPVLRRGYPTDGDWSTIPIPADGRFEDDWRIFARSASDDKSPIVGLLAALDALESAGARPRVNLKFLFDGEEEQGSPDLEPFVRANAGKLAADLMIVADGPRHQSGQPTVVFGARGVMSLTLTAYGPSENLHSGHYGNWAPNPALRLARLLATMKDEDGRVLVEGFYDDVEPLGEMERQAIERMPAMEAELQKRFGIGRPEGGGRRIPELIALPSLNVRGLESAWVGADARTVIPSTATAEIDVRLVRGNRHQRMLEKILAHIRRQGWTVVEREPSVAELTRHAKVVKVVKNDGYDGVRTRMDLPAAQAAVRAVRRMFPGEEVVEIPTSGGSVPIYFFHEVGLPTISVPTVNFDNNQHGPNENLRLGNFFQGIDIFASIFLWE